jgi:hypothetical protein
MVVSASRRTDVPAFHAEWLLTRIRDGAVDVPNPRNPRQVRRVDLTPDAVDAFVFWTKNPLPLMEYLDALAAFPYYFLFTLNSYGPDVEPGVPPLAQRIDAFLRLSDRLGPGRVVWRYDPVLLSDRYTTAFNVAGFAALASRLSGATDACILSFLDEYGRIRKGLRAGGLHTADEEEIRAIAAGFAASGRRHALALSTCAEAVDLSAFGIGHARCIDPERIRRISGRVVPSGKDPAQRPACGCAPSVDIGTYGTCRHGCVYCYAARDQAPPRASDARVPASPGPSSPTSACG